MFQHPVVVTLLQFLGAFCALNFLAQLHVLLWLGTVLGAGVIAAVLWLRTHHPERLLAWSRHAIVDRIATAICRWAGLQPPTAARDVVPPVAVTVDAAAPASVGAVSGMAASGANRAGTRSEPGLQLDSDADWAAARQELHGIAHGHEATVDRLFDLLQSQVRVRAKSLVMPQQPPLATVLLLGPAGVGKRFVAEQIGAQLYGVDAVLTIDLAEGEEHVATLLEAVRRQPRLTLVLDNVQRATPTFLERLQAIVGRGSVREGKDRVVDFRHTFVIAISECDHDAVAAAIGAAAATSGMTMEIQAVAQATSLDALLATLLGQVFWFPFPDTEAQVRVVSQLMAQEATRANLQLTFVDPVVLHREVRAAAAARSFALCPGRIARLLQPRIAEAHARGRSHLDVLAAPGVGPTADATSDAVA